jgi:hypothetical protein
MGYTRLCNSFVLVPILIVDSVTFTLQFRLGHLN